MSQAQQLTTEQEKEYIMFLISYQQGREDAEHDDSQCYEYDNYQELNHEDVYEYRDEYWRMPLSDFE